MTMKWAGSILIASILGLIAFVRLAAAHPFVIDQSNESPTEFTGGFWGLVPSTGNLPIGQEFTPNLPSLDVVELFFAGITVAGQIPGAKMVVHVRQGSITGPTLGTSAIVSLPEITPGDCA